MIRYFSKHPGIAMRQFFPLRASYLRHFSKLITHPILTIGLLIMIATKFTGGGLGFIVGMTESRNEATIDRAKEATVELFRTHALTKWFSKIRFWTGSFNRIESWVPRRGTIIDLGCGYGILSNYLALKSKERRVMGVDLDLDKINRSVTSGDNVTFQYGDITTTKLPKADCIIIADVLHHLSSYVAQDQLIAHCFQLLKRRGRLIISEVDSTPLWKLIAGRIADFVMYPGQPIYYRYTSQMIVLLRRFFIPRQIQMERITDTIFAHVVYICRKE